MIMGGMARYDFAAHDSETSSGAGDEKSLMAPENTAASLLSVESNPVRVSFDGESPTPRHGILLPPGIHHLPFANDITFVSTHEEREATVSVVWFEVTLSS